MVTLLGRSAPAPATDPDPDVDREANAGDGAAGVDKDVWSRVCTVGTVMGVGLGVLAACLWIWPGSSNSVKLSSNDDPLTTGMGAGSVGGSGDSAVAEGEGALGMWWSCVDALCRGGGIEVNETKIN